MSIQIESDDSLDVLLAHRQQSSYFSALSHELRTPLNGLLGYANLLLDGHYGPLTEPQSKAVGEIHGSARYLLGVIESLLEFSKVSQGRQAAKPTPFDAGALLEQLAKRLSPLAEAKKIEVSIEAGPLQCETDPYVIEQMMTNLLGNAIKFTPKGGRVRIVAKPYGQGGVEWGVADTGPGIPAESRARIFEPFVQLAAQSVRAHAGTGIGLALCRNYAAMLQGAIGVEDHFPQGAYVFVLTPAKLAVHPQTAPVAEFKACVAMAGLFAQRIRDQFAVLEVSNVPTAVDPVTALRRFMRPTDLLTETQSKYQLALFGVEPIAARMLGERMKNAFLYEYRASIGVKLLRIEEIL